MITTYDAPKAGDVCPCCKRKVPVVKASGPADKKLKEDIARAEFAIGVCVRGGANLDYSPELRGAIRDEAERLQRAIVTPKLLWSIYRRKDSGPSYVPCSVGC